MGTRTVQMASAAENMLHSPQGDETVNGFQKLGLIDVKSAYAILTNIKYRLVFGLLLYDLPLPFICTIPSLSFQCAVSRAFGT